MSIRLSLLPLFCVCLTNAFSQNCVQKGTDIDGEGQNDNSGISISMTPDAKTLAIGAPLNNGGGQGAGHVRVYSWSGSAWVQMGNDIDGEAAFDDFGNRISLSSDGKTLAVGGAYNDGNGQGAGHVRVFTWTGSTWNQKGSDIDGEAAGDLFGWSVSLNSTGTTLAIGAKFNDGNESDAGHVRVFSWTGSSWIQKGKDIDGESKNDHSGINLLMSSDGRTVAIGATGNDEKGSDAGHVRVFSWIGSRWAQKGNDIDGEAQYDQFGSSISMSLDGNSIAIGATENDGNGSNAGHVRIFNWNGSVWVQKGDDIDGEMQEDNSGYSVSLSSDGSTLAIGAPYNDGNGMDAGHVRVYAWSGSAWVQQGTDMDGEASEDLSGSSVNMNSDGKSLAIGAYQNSGGESFGGHVRVFDCTWNIGIDLLAARSVKIYPNPSTNSFTLDMLQYYRAIELKVMDAVGQIVSTGEFMSVAQVEFEIEGGKGIYLLEINANGRLISAARVIKE